MCYTRKSKKLCACTRSCDNTGLVVSGMTDSREDDKIYKGKKGKRREREKERRELKDIRKSRSERTKHDSKRTTVVGIIETERKGATDKNYERSAQNCRRTVPVDVDEGSLFQLWRALGSGEAFLSRASRLARLTM